MDNNKDNSLDKDAREDEVNTPEVDNSVNSTQDLSHEEKPVEVTQKTENSSENESDSHNEDDTPDESTANEDDFEHISTSEASLEEPEREEIKKSPRAKKWKKITIAAYSALAVLVAGGATYGATMSTASQVDSTVNEDLGRSPYKWSEGIPKELTQTWQRDGFKGLINTSGASIGITENSLERLDDKTGDTLWEYKRKDAELCDATEAKGNVIGLFNAGHGCSELIYLDAATGQYINTAQYATDSDVARLVANDDKAAIVTPSSVLVLRSDGVNQAYFGDTSYPTYSDDQDVRNCEISDVELGPQTSEEDTHRKSMTSIAAKCEHRVVNDDNEKNDTWVQDDNWHIRTIDDSPKEATKGEILLDVDTGSKNPVTIAAQSISMMNFVVQGKHPSVYTWELDKDQDEVAMLDVPYGSYGFDGKNVNGIGYVWRVGDTLYARRGSEDLSQFKKIEGISGDGIEVDGELLVPAHNKAYMWDPQTETKQEIKVDGLSGLEFSFAGGTLMSYIDGKVTGYASSNHT